jgi:hypothetical protein
MVKKFFNKGLTEISNMLENSPQNSVSSDICFTILEKIFARKIFGAKNI